MNRGQAAALLGVGEHASEAEARKAYLARARIMHPDRFSDGTDADKAAATTAMAQLNEAIEVFTSTSGLGRAASADAVIVVCSECGRRNRIRPDVTSKCGACGSVLAGRGTPEPPPDDDDSPGTFSGSDFPTWPDPFTACAFCGWGPAKRVKFNSVIGIIIWWRWSTVDAVFCRECGTFVYNQEQASTLVKGWWGIIAPVANLVAFIGNFARYRAIRNLPEPVGKCWQVPSLVPFPLYGAKPWWKRIAVWVVVVLALLLGLWIAAAAAGAQPRNSFTPSTTSSSWASGQESQDLATGLQVGDCLGGLPRSTGDVDLSALTPSSCAEHHIYEVFGLTRATGTSFSLAGVKDQADTYCTGAFATYVGVPFSLSDLSVSYIYPSAETWAAGDRQLICVVADAKEQNRTDSLRGSGTAAATTSGTVANGSTSTVPEPPAGGKPTRTFVNLTVSGCEGCTFKPYSIRQDEPGTEPYTSWEGKSVTIQNGSAQFSVPTRYTNGMSLQVNAPWESGTYGAVPMAMLSPGSYCWEGTKLPAVVLDIETARYESDDEMYGPAVVPNAYLTSLAEPEFPPGHQDLPYCQVPR